MTLGGHGDFGTEHRVDEVRVIRLAVPGIEQRVVEIGGPVVKSGEEEAQFRGGHHLASRGAVKALVLRGVAQLALSALHRTHGAKHVFIDSSRVADASVLAVMGHVVGIKGQQDQIVSAVHVQVIDNRVIKLVQQGRVLPLAFAQGGEQPVLVAVQHLLGGKGNVQQVFPQSAGKTLFQQRKVFLLLFRCEQAQRFVQRGDDLPGTVHVAAIQMCDAVVLRPDAAADLPQLLLIHGQTILSQKCKGHYGTKPCFCPARNRDMPPRGIFSLFRTPAIRPEQRSFIRARQHRKKGTEAGRICKIPIGKLQKEWMKIQLDS